MGKTTETGGDKTNENWTGTDFTNQHVHAQENVPPLQNFVTRVV